MRHAIRPINTSIRGDDANSGDIQGSKNTQDGTNSPPAPQEEYKLAPMEAMLPVTTLDGFDELEKQLADKVFRNLFVSVSIYFLFGNIEPDTTNDCVKYILPRTGHIQGNQN